MGFNIFLQLVAIIGILLSAYAFYVEKRHSKSKKYKAICDISEKVSCTKTFSSPYGKLFLLPNSVYGIIFFSLVFTLGLFSKIIFIIYLSAFAMLGSAFLAYLMLFKTKSLCIICVGIYLSVLLIHLISMQSTTINSFL